MDGLQSSGHPGTRLNNRGGSGGWQQVECQKVIYLKGIVRGAWLPE